MSDKPKVQPIRPGIRVPDKSASVNKELVETLSNLLEQAEAGEIDGMAYVLNYTDDAAGSGWAGNIIGYAILGQMSVLSLNLADEIRDTSEAFAL